MDCARDPRAWRRVQAEGSGAVGDRYSLPRGDRVRDGHPTEARSKIAASLTDSRRRMLSDHHALIRAGAGLRVAAFLRGCRETSVAGGSRMSSYDSSATRRSIRASPSRSAVRLRKLMEGFAVKLANADTSRRALALSTAFGRSGRRLRWLITLAEARDGQHRARA